MTCFRGTCRNGDFASLLFLNHYEYMRNKTFARHTILPLVTGLLNWWTCFLESSVGTGGRLEDWNPVYPDEENECQPVRNPMIGLAFLRRLTTFQIWLAEELGIPQPTAALSIQRNLIALPTNCTVPLKDGTCKHNDPNASWVSYGNATVKTSSDFSLYPVWPTELVSIGSESELRRTARRTIKTFVKPADFVTQRPVLTFPAAVRAGHLSRDPDESAGYAPEVVMTALKAWLQNTEHNNGVLQDRDKGARLCHALYLTALQLSYDMCTGRVEDCGVVRAVNEMLVAAPNDGTYIELFPFFPANESASFTTLRAKGGWLVTASKAQATAADLANGSQGAVTGVEIFATTNGTAQLVSPWLTSMQIPTVSCHPAPIAPSVHKVRLDGGRPGLAWEMIAGQACMIYERNIPEIG